MTSTTIALAGRRIDAPDTSPARFPLDRVSPLAHRLRAMFRDLKATTLVSSAANGADLVALRVARELGMRRRIVLPFSAARFRRASVTDRPGGELWGWLFDDLVPSAREQGDLVVLARGSNTQAKAFAAANARIIREAQRLARGKRAAALVVWDGKLRGKDDATAGFAELARAAGLPVKTVRIP